MENPSDRATAAPPSTGAAFRIVPFALLVAFVALGQLLSVSPLAHAFDLRWLTVARAGAVALVLAFAWPQYGELRERLTARALALAVASGLVVFILWIALDRGFGVLPSPQPGFVPLDAAGRLDPWLYATRLAGFAIVVPLAEELFWRSFLLRWIDRRRFLEQDPRASSARAFAICSVLFAIEHSQWLAGLAAGTIYTGVYTRTGNLRAPIVSHAITNAALGIFILATGSWSLW